MRCLLCVGSIKKEKFTVKINEVVKIKIEESKKILKRVNLVSVKLIKEGSILHESRRVSSFKDAFELDKEFLIDSDEEKFILVCLDNKNKRY